MAPPPTPSNDGKDPFWQYGTSMNGPKPEIKYVKCKFCEQVVKGGIFRLKHHFAKTHKNIKPCSKVPDDVFEQAKAFFEVSQRQKIMKRQDIEFQINRGSYYQGNVNEDVGGGSGRASNPSVTGPTPSGGGSNVNACSDGIVRGPMDRFLLGSGTNNDMDLGRGISTQEMKPQPVNAKEYRNQVCSDIGRFFIENDIPFNVANSHSFTSMLLSVSKYAAHNNGHCVKPPSAHELSTWILKEEVKSTNVIVDEVKKTWPHSGVTIMSDGWKDMRGRQLINFLVNNPEGTVFHKSVDASDIVKDANALFELLDSVVEEVGEENVVQIVTDNAANYKAAGKKLMEKRKHLYWTPCAAHCIDLMLGDLFRLPTLANAYRKAKQVSNYIYNHGWVLALMRSFTGRDLVRPASTRFGTGCLTLESIKKNRQKLELMFASNKWSKSQYAKQAEGKAIKKIISRDNNFWPGVSYSLKATEPLLHVLRIVDSETTPAMGFLYEAMEKAKQEIASSFNNELAKYKEIWDIIDKRWDFQLHRDLHATAYYLNPKMDIDRKSPANFKLKQSLFNCVDRMVTNEASKADLHDQMGMFIDKKGLFGRSEAEVSRQRRNPDSWWRYYGDNTPDLQSFAIKVLSLTCSSSACERNWSTFNHVHTKKRNRLAATKLNALVYVMYNKRLRAKKLMLRGPSEAEDALFPTDSNAVDSDNEWLVELDNEAEPPTQTADDGNGVGNPPQELAPKVSNPCPEALWHQNLDEIDVNAIVLDGNEEGGENDESRKRKNSNKKSAPTQAIDIGRKQAKTHGGSTSGKGSKQQCAKSGVYVYQDTTSLQSAKSG